MRITIERKYKKEKYTIGKMFLDGVYFCDTLEDTVRPKGVKIYGETAIPASTYKVVLSYSPKFKRVLPEVLSVPNFSGIRIHRGNTAKDTLGCVLVGKNKVVGGLTESADTEIKLMERLKREKEIWLTIKD